MDIAYERSYPTPVANSPLLPLLLMTLATQRNAPKEASSIQDEYDYIIVGGGSAGSVVANRLSEMKCVKVLLVEAGKEKPPKLNDVPAFGRYFWDTPIDWALKTTSQKHAAYLLTNKQVIWPSGKGLGGSSLLNAMLYVRGNSKDYDNWEAQGAKGWGYKDVFPYFLKLEDNQDLDFLEDGYHAIGGPITAKKPAYVGELKYPIREAAKQMGYDIVDSNAARQTGFYDHQGNLRNGQRCSTAKGYLVPAENRTNLDIVGGAFVRKVLFNGTTAVGVQLDYNNATYEIKARREVIMSAGTVNTAQLLMLSGIGPKEHLEKFNISVIADLPVGDNFQDHPGFPLPFTFDSMPLDEKLNDTDNIMKYIDNRTGPLSSPEMISAMAFLQGLVIYPEDDFPDHEIYWLEIDKRIVKTQVGIIPLLYEIIFGPYQDGPMSVCVTHLVHPKSRGTVRLNSTDPYDPPLIDPNYFADSSDVDAIVKGMETCRKLGYSDPMKKVGVKPFETVLPFFTKYFPDFLIEWYFQIIGRSLIITLSHQVGTAKMGDPNDNTTVVDPQLRVKGVQNLRVVDASVMPLVPSGNTNIPTIMVAEKASDIIKETISCPSD